MGDLLEIGSQPKPTFDFMSEQPKLGFDFISGSEPKTS